MPLRTADSSEGPAVGAAEAPVSTAKAELVVALCMHAMRSLNGGRRGSGDMVW